MAEIKVSAEHEYTVRITGDWRGDLSPFLAKRSRVAIIFPATMASEIPTFPSHDREIHLLPVPDGEAGKSPQTLHYLWNELGRLGFTRSDVIVAVGGGTITDLSGFVAASWLRGMDWIAVPTTLAGMVDASVGGKTGVNSPYGKNLIGAFHSPISVLIDSAWITTLSDRDIAAGLAEVVKCGFIDNPEILSMLEGKTVTEVRTNSALVNSLIEKSIATKAKVVSDDFKESSLREILNYGHTFGHAVERVSDYSIRHGEAVAIGMVFIAELSFARGLISQEILNLHRSSLTALSLPTSLTQVQGRDNWSSIYSAMALDKKARGNEIRFVTLTELGKCERIEGVTEEELRGVYEKLLS